MWISQKVTSVEADSFSASLQFEFTFIIFISSIQQPYFGLPCDRRLLFACQNYCPIAALNETNEIVNNCLVWSWFSHGLLALVLTCTRLPVQPFEFS